MRTNCYQTWLKTVFSPAWQNVLENYSTSCTRLKSPPIYFPLTIKPSLQISWTSHNAVSATYHSLSRVKLLTKTLNTEWPMNSSNINNYGMSYKWLPLIVKRYIITSAHLNIHSRHSIRCHIEEHTRQPPPPNNGTWQASTLWQVSRIYNYSNCIADVTEWWRH
jgi:hypothetical protein